MNDHPPLTGSHRCRLRKVAVNAYRRTSRFAGIYYHSRDRRWVASIRDAAHGLPKAVRLGTFREEAEAAAAYDFALIILGYPPINFPPQVYQGTTPPEALRAKLRRRP